MAKPRPGEFGKEGKYQSSDTLPQIHMEANRRPYIEVLKGDPLHVHVHLEECKRLQFGLICHFLTRFPGPSSGYWVRLLGLVSTLPSYHLLLVVSSVSQRPGSMGPFKWLHITLVFRFLGLRYRAPQVVQFCPGPLQEGSHQGKALPGIEPQTILLWALCRPAVNSPL